MHYIEYKIKKAWPSGGLMRDGFKQRVYERLITRQTPDFGIWYSYSDCSRSCILLGGYCYEAASH